MLTILPCLAFVLLWLLFAGGETPVQGMAPRWRRAFLLALLTWATILILVLEGLSLVDGIRQATLAAAWGVIVACLGAWCQRRGLFRIAVARVRAYRFDLTPVEVVLAGGIVAVSATLLLVAVVSPPNNVNSLLYHMARVAHWAQNGSLSHYAAVYQHQLSMPPWAELAALNLYVLWGGDRLVNLVQWFALVASLILASGVAALLGASRPFQYLAAALVLSLPDGPAAVHQHPERSGRCALVARPGVRRALQPAPGIRPLDADRRRVGAGTGAPHQSDHDPVFTALHWPCTARPSEIVGRHGRRYRLWWCPCS